MSTSPFFRFEILYTSRTSRARVGRIHTPHGIIDTPHFVPVATNAALKGVDALLAEDLAIHLMFCNTYHLMLHPGADTVAQAGGLHHFMKRSRPIITDSGGFQVFSLAYGGVHEELKSKGTKRQHGSVLSITEEGVTFRSYRDGSSLLLTPESSIQAQKKLGADIILPLDELPPYHQSARALRSSFERTHRWQKRSIAEHLTSRQQQALYGIVHGGVDGALRKSSVEQLLALSCDGLAIGGSLGKNCAEMLEMLRPLSAHLDPHMPVHLLGIGDLPSLQGAIPLGIDTFDSSYPSRNARHGLLLTKQGPLNILRSAHAQEHIPVDTTCSCKVCATHTRAYIHHLFKAHELSAYTVATLHNMQYMVDLMAEYRSQILRDEI